MARVSVVNLEGKIIYDKLVKPDNPIRDYLTRYRSPSSASIFPH